MSDNNLIDYLDLCKHPQVDLFQFQMKVVPSLICSLISLFFFCSRLNKLRKTRTLDLLQSVVAMRNSSAWKIFVDFNIVKKTEIISFYVYLESEMSWWKHMQVSINDLNVFLGVDVIYCLNWNCNFSIKRK